MVSHHYSESFMLLSEFEALSDSTVKSNCLMQGHGGPPSMVSLVNTPTCKHKEGRKGLNMMESDVLPSGLGFRSRKIIGKTSIIFKISPT